MYACLHADNTSAEKWVQQVTCVILCTLHSSLQTNYSDDDIRTGWQWTVLIGKVKYSNVMCVYGTHGVLYSACCMMVVSLKHFPMGHRAFKWTIFACISATLKGHEQTYITYNVPLLHVAIAACSYCVCVCTRCTIPFLMSHQRFLQLSCIT